jgi:diadenosine tetraphosphate (Ap4A) HIT family hydrolase
MRWTIRGSFWCARRGDAVEFADLGSDAFPLTAEIGVMSLELKELTRCDKINIAATGNVVAQLHIHIVARWKTDPLYRAGVWRNAAAARQGSDV